MIDRKALAAALEDEKRITDPDFDDYTIEVNSSNFAVIYQAAIRQLSAPDAIVIEKDADGGWPIVFADQLRFVRRGRGGTELNFDSLRAALAPQIGERAS